MKGTTTTRIFKEGTNWSHLFHSTVLFFFFHFTILALGLVERSLRGFFHWALPYYDSSYPISQITRALS